MYLEDVFVTGPSLAGLPAISIPAGFVDDLPIGVQLIGARFDEKTIFNFAHIFQENTEYHKQKAKI
jgi:aspartyl-tRNA(Asn)/glutamyl-tRNA(Gln) amidotransferase subunit A